MKGNRVLMAASAGLIAISLCSCEVPSLKPSSGNIDTQQESVQESVHEAESVQEESEVKTDDGTVYTTLKAAVSAGAGGMHIGAAATGNDFNEDRIRDLIMRDFDRVTLGNELKPDSMFGYSNGRCPGTEEAELNGETITVPKINYTNADRALDKILSWNEQDPDNAIQVRGHTLLWHAQTPEWWFHVDYNKKKDYVDPATMSKRMEWYIREMMNHYVGEDSPYKDLFYGWDVLNEAVADGTGTYRHDDANPNEKLSEDTHGSNSSWWHVYGSEQYIVDAFTYANKYAPASLELYYNDYNDSDPTKVKGICKLLQLIKDHEGAPGEGTRVDAFGMQGHYGTGDDNPSVENISAAIDAYCDIVGHVQFTEVDLSASSQYDGTKAAQDKEYERNAARYESIYNLICEKNKDTTKVTSFTLWGTTDDRSWLQSRSNLGGGNRDGLPCVPLLFDKNYEPKPSYYVFFPENSRPAPEDEDAKRERIFSEMECAESDKGDSDNNPLYTQRFGADPGAMTVGNRVYVYMTNDILNRDTETLEIKENDYSRVTQINCISSTDLVNWTDYGAIPVAGKGMGIAKWASNSWAPCAAHKTIDGQERYFLYFANGGNGIGVLTADAPEGPWTDPLGEELISRSTPTCKDVLWLFDPAVFVDDDGTGYLAFGGGVPDGKADNPGTARIVKLGPDMISLDGDPVQIDVPYLFEDSGLNKINGRYYYSYCSNWNTQGNDLGISNAAIEYMTADDPMGPYTYGGEIFKNPGTYFGEWNNNHHSIAELDGRLYLFYHARAVEQAMGLGELNYRSPQLEELTMDGDRILEVQGTMRGIADAVRPFNPYEPVPASTMSRQGGITVQGVTDTRVSSIDRGDWVALDVVDFDRGATSVTLKAKAENGAVVRITVLGSQDDVPPSYVEIPECTKWTEITASVDVPKGTYTRLIFTFSDKMELSSWQFSE